MAEAAVVVPFRGEWSSVIPTLDALNSQTARSRLSVILSIDGTEVAPPEVSDKVDICINGPHGGPAVARNRGWIRSDAPLILFTDSDCIPEPRWAERMIEKLGDEYQAVKGVYSAGGQKPIQRLAQIEFQERYRLMQKSETIHLADTYSAGFRRNWLEKLGGFDEGFPLPEHEDVDLSWRLTSSGGRIGFVFGAAVKHTHRSSWGAYFRMKYRRGKWRIMLVRKFPARAVSDGYTPQTLKLQMLFSPPVALSMILIPFYPAAALFSAVFFLLLCFPVMLTALRTDPAMLPLVPLFCIWRGTALCLGAVAGLTGGGLRCSHQ